MHTCTCKRINQLKQTGMSACTRNLTVADDISWKSRCLGPKAYTGGGLLCWHVWLGAVGFRKANTLNLKSNIRTPEAEASPTQSLQTLNPNTLPLRFARCRSLASVPGTSISRSRFSVRGKEYEKRVYGQGQKSRFGPNHCARKSGNRSPRPRQRLNFDVVAHATTHGFALGEVELIPVA